jgi:hypothetical protein
MVLSGKFIVETKQELGKENFGRDLKGNLKACTLRKKMDRIGEVKCHTPRYSMCVDGEFSTVVDFAVGTNWVRDRLDLMWDGKCKAIPVQTWTSPEGSRSLRLLDFETVGT